MRINLGAKDRISAFNLMIAFLHLLCVKVIIFTKIDETLPLMPTGVPHEGASHSVQEHFMGFFSFVQRR